LTTARSRKAESVAQKSQTPQVPATADSIALEDRAVAKQQDVAAPAMTSKPPGRRRDSIPGNAAPGCQPKANCPPEQATGKKAASSPEPAIFTGTAADDMPRQPPPRLTKRCIPARKGRMSIIIKQQHRGTERHAELYNGYTSLDKEATAPSSLPAK